MILKLEVKILVRKKARNKLNKIDRLLIQKIKQIRNLIINY
jgi:hypothetical protein